MTKAKWTVELCVTEVLKYTSCQDWKRKGGASAEFIRKKGLSLSQFYNTCHEQEPTEFQKILWTSTADNEFEVGIAWACAEKIYENWVRLGYPGAFKVYSATGIGSYNPYRTMIKKFEGGWIPRSDVGWNNWAADKKKELGIF